MVSGEGTGWSSFNTKFTTGHSWRGWQSQDFTGRGNIVRYLIDTVWYLIGLLSGRLNNLWAQYLIGSVSETLATVSGRFNIR